MAHQHPLTFHQAKLLVNPDPDFKVIPDSQEHKDIVALRKQSGAVNFKDVFPAKEVVKPRVIQKITPPARIKLSKDEFLSIKTNRDKVEAHIKLHKK